ncbi:MAG: hypothetical protein IJV16_00365 [Lachnospiraceae bacterium]|nr:hypothetical protein [Lachnospiraceae bacterium]MBR1523343.1 hypothetical protein [Lachnospiraceae bacterium]
MDKRFAIDDENLENVSGGIAEVGDDPQVGGRCPYCTTLMNRTATGYVCPDCGSVFDMNGNQIGGTTAVNTLNKTNGIGGAVLGKKR